MRKRADIRLTAAAFILTLAFAAADAQDAVKDTLSGAVLSGGTNTASYADSSVNTVNNVDIVNDADTVDTINTVNTAAADTADAVDTVNIVNAVNNIDTAGAVNTVNNDSAAAGRRPPLPKPDAAAPPMLSGAYWGFGAGLSVGTAPIFPMWQDNFPKSLRPLGLADTGYGETAPLQYSVTAPDEFNFAIPFRLSLCNVGEKHIFSFAVSFFRNSKEFQSALSINDTAAARRIDLLEKLSYYSVSIEAAGDWAIPPVFFSVDGSQQTYLSLALGVSPVNAFARECEIKTDFKDGDSRMKAAADSVGKKFAALSGNGLSLSWRAGVSVVKRYESGYGAVFGLFYSGAYSGRFYSEGVRLTEDRVKKRGFDLNAEEVTGGKPLSFLSSQAEFRATLLVPTRKGRRQKNGLIDTTAGERSSPLQSY